MSRINLVVFERVCRLLHAGEVGGPPAGITNVVVVLAASAVDQFAGYVSVSGVVGRLGEHPDQQGAGGGVTVLFWPPGHVGGGGEAEFADGFI